MNSYGNYSSDDEFYDPKDDAPREVSASKIKKTKISFSSPKGKSENGLEAINDEDSSYDSEAPGTPPDMN